MSNRDTEAARAYHEATKLSYINLNNKPPLYKSYSGLPVIPLPQSDLGSTVPALDALTSPMAVAGSSLDLPGLARIFQTDHPWTCPGWPGFCTYPQG